MADQPSGAGEMAAAKRKRAKPPSGSDSVSATEENRLSALPDDVLAKILFSVSTPDAVRTSILSRRWRPMWKLLPELRFPSFPEPAAKFRDALDGHQVPLRHLQVEGSDADGAVPVSSFATWLPAAARRVSGSFVLRNTAPMSDGDEQEEEAAPEFELPCFEKATSISICLGFLVSLAMPPADAPGPGVFSHLTDLRLEWVCFHGPSELDDAISSARSPCLQELKVRRTRGLEKLTVRSTSLLKMELELLSGLRELTVETPELKGFTVVHCFMETVNSEVVIAIAAPGLVFLNWADPRSQTYLQLIPSEVPNLHTLGSFLLLVYGDVSFGDEHTAYNNACLDLLQGFEFIESLTLMLGYVMDIHNNYQYLMEDMRLLPDVTTLHLIVITCGHSFGASLFHVLRMCTIIRKLVLELAGPSPGLEGPFTCPSGCICDQQSNWQNEELVLVPLHKIEIKRFGQSNHDIAVVQKLFGWAKSLVKATVIFDISITEDMAKELCGMFKHFSRPEIHLKFKYHNNKKVFDAMEG